LIGPNINLFAEVRILKVLMVTGMYPTPDRPHYGSFVASQTESLRAAGIYVDLVYPSWGAAPIRYVWGATQVFWRTLGGEYDVVHAHFGLWGWAARAQFRSPVVMSFLGDDLLGRPDGHGGKTFRSRLVVSASLLLGHVVNAVIVKSNEMATCLPGVACEVIPNGVDFERFSPRDRVSSRKELDWHPTERYVVFVANPSEQRKRFDLAQAAVRVAEKNLGRSIHLVVVSGKPPDVVALHMNAADALLLTSDWEGSPNVVKEAMACNLPVVSVAVGDVAEVIGRTVGCAISRPEVSDIAEKLNSVIESPRRTTGRSDIEHLEIGTVARRVIAVYSRLVRSADSV
jgi:glycosyltransferase involved in cell wall biosynthesis